MEALEHAVSADKIVLLNAVGLLFLILKELVRFLFSNARAKRAEERKRRLEEIEQKKKEEDKQAERFDQLASIVKDLQNTMTIVRVQVEMIKDVVFKGNQPSTDP